MKKNSHSLRKFINFFDIHNPFTAAINELVSIVTSDIVSDDINVDLAVNIGTKTVSGLDERNLVEISFKRKNQTKTFATVRKSIKVGKTVNQM